MEIRETKLKGCFLLNPRVFKDDRGYFFESFNQREFDKAIGYTTHFVQDNQSQSSYGVIRGLHMQLGTFAQAKLVRAIKGEILDVAVDLRPNSDTYGKFVSYVLSEENKQQLFVPRGFAHGFSVLSDVATIHYKADNFYASNAESGLIYNDKELSIDWGIEEEKIITSEKDLILPSLKEFDNE
ncbi:MAG: dTDP-4-dehydrorhamnose 3,5-epimerase [Cyclobacteriaceae bacterium]|nr:dTDP-4-dehydrorhamnose 3,5-epimerase [Cyclobacteriaceae bacterium]